MITNSILRIQKVSNFQLRIDTGDMAWYVMATVKRLHLNNC